jgi:outer membrane protein OmpA-like peptidoglycan-associated protein
MKPSLLLALALAACASPARLAADHTSIKQDATLAHTLQNCAPEALARMDAELAFVELEFEQGSTRRAAEHLAEAKRQLVIVQGCPAVAKAKPKSEPKPEPKPEPVVVADTDRDGVLDNEDLCPREPEDLDGFKDGDGCAELDNDLDGVSDMTDRCPNDTEDQDGHQDSDGCPDPDNDGDTFLDASDRCPNEAGVAEEGGCPVYDRDRDGIVDKQDTCPDQPENPNGYLDLDGCPDSKPQFIEITAEQIKISQQIKFATGKATILQASWPIVDAVAQVLRDYPRVRVEVGGHTDNKGPPAVNRKLSQQRADAVVKYLVGKGIAADRLTARGYGPDKPLDTNMTEAGRAANRRVEFLIVEGGVPPAPVGPPR